MWVELLWPNREAQFGSRHVASGCHPTFTWGYLKVDREAIRHLFRLPASSSFFTFLLRPLLHCSSSARRWIYTHGWCATDVLFHEPWQSD